MFHKVSDGDILKIFPLLKKNGEYSFCDVYLCSYMGGRLIYDTSGKDYLNKMIKLSGKKIPLTKRHIFSTYVNGRLRFISVGARLMNIISDQIYNSLSKTSNIYDDNMQLLVSVSQVDSGHASYPSYDKSKFIEKDWTKPVSGDVDDWKRWIKGNQPCLEDYLDKFSLHRNISILKKELGDKFILSELIAKERDIRIDEILKEENNDLFA